MAYGLTKCQSDLLAYLKAETEAGHAPSYEQIKTHLGLASKSGVHRLVAGLKERGHVSCIPGRARTLTVVEPLEALSTGHLLSMADRITGILAKRRSEAEA